MHTSIHFTSPPRRRLGCLALIRNAGGGVLLVEKKYKKDQGDPYPWGLPGGCAEENEDPLAAARREVEEELGLAIELGEVLAVHHMPREGDSAEGINLVFHGGTAPAGAIIRLPEELSGYEFVAPSELARYAAPYTVSRIKAALAAIPFSGAQYRSGHPTDAH
ncbi:NUDIX domain-containing protein [Streptomyces sp. Da 82-17]|uniref:NUDIX domain-containing protein n=1 Tax=Streptomyces sp. Da 82-17 TaxID=3377116 RepID=UPI0038D40EC1